MVTRASESGGDLAERLERRGAQIRNIELIRIGPPPDERALQAAVDAAHEYDWLVFTSVNGVRNFSARRAQTLAGGVRIAAIGPATADAVREQVRPAGVVQPKRFVAEALADELLQRAKPSSRVLLLQAADARPVLDARLRAAGMQVTAVAAYSTVVMPPDDLALRLRDCDVVTLASASAVRSLVDGLGGAPHAAAHLRGKLVACIGPVTEHEARERGLHVELVPPQATAESLVDALCGYYAGLQP